MYMVDLGGRKLGSLFGTKKKVGNLDKVSFFLELEGGEAIDSIAIQANRGCATEAVNSH
jgi:hypothetical protein